MKRVRGGGHPSSVALKSLELFNAELAGRAREAQGVSTDGLHSFTSTSAELREGKDESSGKFRPIFSSLGLGFLPISLWQAVERVDEF